MSSIIVYGDDYKMNKHRIIDRSTLPKPSNFYGNSKLLAEKGLEPLESNNFKVVILRPPMIYGKGSKGNYPILATYAKKLPIFPAIENQRSMLHIDNLSEFVRLIIDNSESGYFYPQNKDYVNTSLLVKEIANSHGKNIKLIKVFNPFLKLMANRLKVINKVFGNSIYDKDLSDYKDFAYCVHDFKESVRITEN